MVQVFLSYNNFLTHNFNAGKMECENCGLLLFGEVNCKFDRGCGGWKMIYNRGKCKKPLVLENLSCNEVIIKNIIE